MSLRVSTDYLSIGANRLTAAADWVSDDADLHADSIVAFGAGCDIALWKPLDRGYRGISHLLHGHSDTVTCLAFVKLSTNSELCLISGSSDKSIKYWKLSGPDRLSATPCTIGEHNSSITKVVVLPSLKLLISTSGDSNLKVWSLQQTQGKLECSLVEELRLKFIPLALATYRLDEDSYVVALAGSNHNIQIYSISTPDFKLSLQATLLGHEGWIRGLDFTMDSTSGDILLISASQDKFIRLWRLGADNKTGGTAVRSQTDDRSAPVLGKFMSTKAYKINTTNCSYTLTFEALLVGHEDWIYSISWNKGADGQLKLLSCSADNSLIIWQVDALSGIWVSNARLGDVSDQKGSTTATGSAGGFWNGLWSPDGKAVMSLGRTGSWRLWTIDDGNRWITQPAVSGHTKSVSDISWTKSGSYLLSTSHDQTTRLHAQWLEKGCWREFARPQIHGYDLNCLATITPTLFISGADEKPLRILQQPGVAAAVLEKFCGIKEEPSNLPTAANIPALGLSNKATDEQDEEQKSSKLISIQNTPPTEDELSKSLLFPELQKLYGHGYEIATMAVSNNSCLVATAAKASSQAHAVIRVYETNSWREVSVLTGHTLTVTGLAWSPDDRYLLSASRDRTWGIFERINDEFDKGTIIKGHSRMILGCAWAPSDNKQYLFSTASRDKTVKLWLKNESNVWDNVLTLTTEPSAATAVAMHDRFISDQIVMAVGLESGEVIMYLVDKQYNNDHQGDQKATFNTTCLRLSEYGHNTCPTKSVTKLAFRPEKEFKGDSSDTHDSPGSLQLALSSQDSSLRILNLHIVDPASKISDE